MKRRFDRAALRKQTLKCLHITSYFIWQFNRFYPAILGWSAGPISIDRGSDFHRSDDSVALSSTIRVLTVYSLHLSARAACSRGHSVAEWPWQSPVQWEEFFVTSRGIALTKNIVPLPQKKTTSAALICQGWLSKILLEGGELFSALYPENAILKVASGPVRALITSWSSQRAVWNFWMGRRIVVFRVNSLRTTSAFVTLPRLQQRANSRGYPFQTTEVWTREYADVVRGL